MPGPVSAAPLRRRGPLTSPPSPLAALWRVRGYLRPYAGRFAFLMVSALAVVGTNLSVPLLIKAAVDGPVAHGDRGGLVLLAVAVAALGSAEAVLNALRRYLEGRTVLSVERAMRNDLYSHLQTLHAGFHDGWQSGQLLSRAGADLSAIRRFAGFGAIFLVVNLTTFVAVTVLLIRLDTALGAIVGLSLLPILAVCTGFERRYRALSRRVQDLQGDLATRIEEAAAGIRVIKALGRRVEVFAAFTAAAREIYRAQLRKARLRGVFLALLDVIPGAALALVLLLGAIEVGRGEMTIGALIAFIALVLQLVWPIQSMGYILAMAEEAATAAQRVYEVLDTQPAIRDRPGAIELDRDQVARVRGHVRFEGVRYSHPGARRPVLRGVDLELLPGETVALVGATGSGKTTLLSLLPRLIDPTGGRVTVDGVDIADFALATLRRIVACGFEDPTLFSASVRENITLGAPEAGDAEIAAALAVAQADFVHDLPWGLDTRIGEQGMSLSGGQRQRLALARAILARPRVLVLDDPLSALDVATERRVEQALAQVLETTTALVVAHRPSTVALADRVALLHDGVIAAVGDHRELLTGRPAYRALLCQEVEAYD